MRWVGCSERSEDLSSDVALEAPTLPQAGPTATADSDPALDYDLA